MAIIIETENLKPQALKGEHEYWTYNGLDCCVTHEVDSAIPLDEYGQRAYEYSLSLQAPVLEMQLRGWRIDQALKESLLSKVVSKQSRLRSIILKYSQALGQIDIMGPKSISRTKLKELLYEKLKLPPQYELDKATKEKKLSTNRDALEHLQNYFHVKPLILALLSFQDLDEERKLLGTPLDPDGRLRGTYNIGGTETWRFSMSKSSSGSGRSLHNIEASLRQIFCSDEGYKFCNIDEETAESRGVGWLAYIVSGKANYLKACESGDLHTYVARLVWPTLGWTGDIKQDKKIAQTPFYREFTYRDMAKRGGHATNYLTTPPTMAKHLKIPVEVCRTFQQLYFDTFPEIKIWHSWTATQLHTCGYLDNPFGFRRFFLGRRYSDDTLRQAIAHVPQSTISIIAKIGLFRIWKEFPQCLVQHENHDNVVFQYPEDQEMEIVPKAIKLMELRIPPDLLIKGLDREKRMYYTDIDLVIPCSAKIGWIWAEKEDLERSGYIHPDALISFKGERDGRTRAQSPKHLGGVR